MRVASVKTSTGLKAAVCLVVLWPAVCLCETTAGYDAYRAWEQWARLRTGAQAGLASSYDREGGNLDFSQYEEPNGVRTVDEVVTVKTIAGPGVIYRFWMPHLTAKRDFIVRMYFDGEQTPRIDTSSAALLGGAFSYFTYPLVTTCAGGQVCYEPIPFAKSIRIETENKASANRHYYQYSYSKVPGDAAIESYTEILTQEQEAARADVVTLFDNAGQHPAGGSDSAIDINTPMTVIKPDSSVALADVNGPGMIRKLNIRMDDANDAELDGLRLRVYYDGNDTAAIDVSVGDFFGAGRGRAAYKSITLGTDSNDGFYCYWPMPFRREVAVSLLNTTDVNIPIDSACVQYEPDADVEKMCYLHAIANTSIKQEGQIYHPILARSGCGHYVGNLLYTEQESYSFSMLEGDEVITVDQNNILNGTGLEDAYNGGYYYNWVGVQQDEPEGEYPQSAIRPLHGILYVHRQEGIEYARADQYRWQIADCVPFSRGIEVKIENRYAVKGAKWTSVAFWYQYHCLGGDFDKDCDVDFLDFGSFASQWLKNNCEVTDWCSGADFDHSREVGAEDLAALVENWL